MNGTDTVGGRTRFSQSPMKVTFPLSRVVKVTVLNAEFRVSIREWDGPTFILVVSPLHFPSRRTIALSSKGGRNELFRASRLARVLPIASSLPLSLSWVWLDHYSGESKRGDERTGRTDDRSIEDSVHWNWSHQRQTSKDDDDDGGGARAERGDDDTGCPAAQKNIFCQNSCHLITVWSHPAQKEKQTSRLSVGEEGLINDVCQRCSETPCAIKLKKSTEGTRWEEGEEEEEGESIRSGTRLKTDSISCVKWAEGGEGLKWKSFQQPPSLKSSKDACPEF